MRIEEAYIEKSKKSAAMAIEGRKYLAGGMSTDTRYCKPHSLYFERAEGSRKYDVDGNEYIDYFGGHGSLMLGHCHPEVQAAAIAAYEKGSQYASGHPWEIEWARRVTENIPSADKVRFTASGTEATHLAIRMARAYTGKPKLIRFKGHYHGWHDHTCSGYSSHMDGSVMTGVLPAIGENTILLTAGDSEALQAAFRNNDDIAGLIMEPTGAHFGTMPMLTPPKEVLDQVRQLCTEHKAVFILDEVVSAFRIDSGSAQEFFGVKPDLTTLGKILTGGLSGGAVAGREDIMALLDFDYTREHGLDKIMHQGTFTGHPASAASGMKTLDIITSTDVCSRANQHAETLRVELNLMMEKYKLPWAFFGDYSVFHFFTNPLGHELKPGDFDQYAYTFEEYSQPRKDIVDLLFKALVVEGVTLNRYASGFLSGAHTEEDVSATLIAFDRAIPRVKAELGM